jgi:hypothetical protein
MMMALYFAYGSNLSMEQMQRRCPAAEPLDKLYLPDARLVFRMVADVVFEPGFTCPGGVWRITPDCERALDHYEGYRPDGSGMYRKVFVEVDGLPDGETELMLYVMNSTGIMPPAVNYYHVILDGYEDFGLRTDALRFALKHAHDEKHATHVERKRLRRGGRPALKARPVPKVPKVRKGKRKPKGKHVPVAGKIIAAAPRAAAAAPAKVRSKLGDWMEDQRRSGYRC